jgi:hypothetical protein
VGLNFEKLSRIIKVKKTVARTNENSKPENAGN